MPATDADLRHKVMQWLSYGEEDLQLARHGLTMKSAAPYRLIAYHAQQCAEKHLKAFLVCNRVDFPFTHNLSRLVELCQTCRDWPDEFLDAEELTPYAVTTRYPGEDEPVSRQEAVRAIAIAEQTAALVHEALKQAGLRLSGSS
ncbi:HEPN domain-containing protein [Geothermobacter hydrogeniphilus]|uniref:HEPN domain-containing protein n=1 Tax=Geothermobacter hydrogeniphilus TaxID=1969733 RepID=A0A1X0YC09_9BACT|nr:HEPN domain-containing protein [Geothermobacter hydrogeniphilus]ORJ62524.1 hypothetical protein B5V00_04375 [Geothermobacter hydrogeniphilus]